MTILRNILAVIVGVVAGSVVNMALVAAGHRLTPLPKGVDVSDMQRFSETAHLMEPIHFVGPFFAHAVGTLAGALVAYLVAARPKAAFAYGIGAFFLLGGIAMAFIIPAPAWFVVLDLVAAYIPTAWLAVLLGRRIAGAPTLEGGAA